MLRPAAAPWHSSITIEVDWVIFFHTYKITHPLPRVPTTFIPHLSDPLKFISSPVVSNLRLAIYLVEYDLPEPDLPVV